MNKKILMAAVGAALIVGPMVVAQAAPTVYGKFNVGFAKIDSGNTASATVGGDTWAVTTDASRIGVKGDEDLGGGMKALYMFENGVFADSGGWATATSGAASTRDAYAGLSGSNWGTVRLGYYNSAYKMVSVPVEIFGDTVGDFTASGWSGEVRTANTVGYASPDMSGFKAEIESVRGETGTTAEANPMNIALKYLSGPLYVGFGYSDYDVPGTTAAALDGAKKLAGSYAFGDITLVLVLERQDNKGAFQTTDTDHIALSHKLGNNTFAASWTQYNASRNGLSGSNGDYDADQWALGMFHSFSKSTALKFVYTKLSNSKLATSQGRIVTNANVGLSGAAGAGKDVTGLQAQISTSF